MDLQALYHLIVNMTVVKILMFFCFVCLFFYNYFVRNIKKKLMFSELHSKRALLDKVAELKGKGDKEARIAYFFYQLSTINLVLFMGVLLLMFA